ncbi:hypothetical protein AB1Y57_28360, partial [Citrobacter freundii]
STNGQPTQHRAEHHAEQQAAEKDPAQQPPQQEQQGIELVVMVRDTPEFPGGPLRADVHPDEVDNWLALDWRLEE